MLVRSSILALLVAGCSAESSDGAPEQVDDQAANTPGVNAEEADPVGAGEVEAPGVANEPSAPATAGEQLTQQQRRFSEDEAPYAESLSRQPEGGLQSFNFRDANGVSYDALGRSANGETSLNAIASYQQFWFAWVAFNPGSEVFGRTTPVVQPPLETEANCIIPCDEILDGGPGKDGIPALTAPQMVSPDSPDAGYISDNSFVIGFAPPEGSDEPARAYPHNLFWHHEIVNDVVFGTPVAVTHCPLTFSTLTYDPTSFNPGETVELGVSGQLFQSNLVFYNRHDDTYFSQLMSQGVMGPLLGHRPQLVAVNEMTWAAWKTLYPDTLVAGGTTGHARNYERYPYSAYFVDDGNTWSTVVLDDGYENKSITQGLRLGDSAKAYPHEELARVVEEQRGPFAPPRGVINDTLAGQELVIAFDLEAGYVQVFEAPAGAGLFEYVEL